MMSSVFESIPLLFAQATAGNGENADASEPQDKAGEIDFSFNEVREMIDSLVDRLPYIVVGIVVFLLFYFGGNVLRRLIQSRTEGGESANVGQVLGRITRWVMVFLGFLLAVMVIAPSVDPAKLLTSLGIGGVALGFAFKDILQNLMAGLLILLREPFKVGDQIISGDFEGTVESIETRATMIKTYDGRRVVIPNSQIYTSPVVVNTAFDNQRSHYDIGIGYGDDLREAKRVLLDTIKAVEGVLSDPAPEVLVVELAGATVNLRARWWTRSDRASVVHVSDEVIARSKEALDEASIDMPYPTQVVLFHDQTEETDGDRTRQREGWPAGDQPPAARNIAGTIAEYESVKA